LQSFCSGNAVAAGAADVAGFDQQLTACFNSGTSNSSRHPGLASAAAAGGLPFFTLAQPVQVGNWLQVHISSNQPCLIIVTLECAYAGDSNDLWLLLHGPSSMLMLSLCGVMLQG